MTQCDVNNFQAWEDCQLRSYSCLLSLMTYITIPFCYLAFHFRCSAYRSIVADRPNSTLCKGKSLIWIYEISFQIIRTKFNKPCSARIVKNELGVDINCGSSVGEGFESKKSTIFEGRAGKRGRSPRNCGSGVWERARWAPPHKVLIHVLYSTRHLRIQWNIAVVWTLKPGNSFHSCTLVC